MANFFIYIGFIAMVLSGSCSLWALAGMDSQYVSIESIAFIGGIPFVVGLIIFLLAGGWHNKNN